MSQKGFPNFSNSGQNAKEIFNTSQKGQPTLEKRFQEEFPPLVSDGKDDLPTQIAVENFLNRSPLEALAATENTTEMLSQQSLRQNKQDSNFSLKNEALTGQYKNEFAFFSLNQRPPLKEVINPLTKRSFLILINRNLPLLNSQAKRANFSIKFKMVNKKIVSL